MVQKKNRQKTEDQETLRHSTAHVLAMAVLRLYPKAKLAIGPAIEGGFYYDIDFPEPISEEELQKIEKEMKKIVKEKKPFERTLLERKEAKKIYQNNPYKKDLLEEIKDKKISFYKSGEFIDLCRGPHVRDTGKIGAFKLTHTAGAYWRGDEKNPMLTRIYGLAFKTEKELEKHLKLLEEAKNRDHRKIGKEQNLFIFTDLVGKGLPLLTPKGSVIRRELERFIVDEELKRGYMHVYTPDLARVELYEKSGHYPYYKDSMYPPMEVGEEKLILRPMTCPHHYELYASQPRSYRDLPFRLAELAKQYRFEKSGELTGLLRVRTFTLADSHIICRKNQAEEEINLVLDLIEDSSKALGLEKVKDYRYRLSLGDRKDKSKYYKDDKAWNFAEGVLRRVLKKRKEPFFEARGEAAFYGPKIDIQMRNVSGKEETAFTVQYDFVAPKRFDLYYVNEKGKRAEPVVIHRSSIGSLERTIAFLIEHYAGAFPVWLSPVQAVIIPISQQHNRYGQKIEEELKGAGVRVELDDRSETMQAKIRDAQLQKIPYMLIVGGKEQKNKSVSIRLRDGKDLGPKKVSSFIKKISEIIQKKETTLW
jgi:threonyl-tRNA synthetase